MAFLARRMDRVWQQTGCFTGCRWHVHHVFILPNVTNYHLVLTYTYESNRQYTDLGVTLTFEATMTATCKGKLVTKCNYICSINSSDQISKSSVCRKFRQYLWIRFYETKLFVICVVFVIYLYLVWLRN